MTQLTPMTTNKKTAAAIEWRQAPSTWDEQTREEDKQWSEHSICPPAEAAQRVKLLAESQSEPGLFEFRVRP